MGAFAQLANLLLGATMIASLAGCASAPVRDATRLKTPQSMADLLVNVREATRTGMILDYAFVKEDNLKHVLGGSKVRLERIDVGPTVQLRGYITEFPDWASARRPEGSHLEVVVTWYRGNISDYRPVGDIRIRDNQSSGATTETIDQVFGRSWVKREPLVHAVTRHGPSGALFPETYLGGETIVYQLGPATLDRKVEVFLEKDGTLDGLAASANGAYRGM
jgi:hypothetical protein